MVIINVEKIISKVSVFPIPRFRTPQNRRIWKLILKIIWLTLLNESQGVICLESPQNFEVMVSRCGMAAERLVCMFIIWSVRMRSMRKERAGSIATTVKKRKFIFIEGRSQTARQKIQIVNAFYLKVVDKMQYSNLPVDLILKTSKWDSCIDDAARQPPRILALSESRFITITIYIHVYAIPPFLILL